MCFYGVKTKKCWVSKRKRQQHRHRDFFLLTPGGSSKAPGQFWLVPFKKKIPNCQKSAFLASFGGPKIFRESKNLSTSLDRRLGTVAPAPAQDSPEIPVGGHALDDAGRGCVQQLQGAVEAAADERQAEKQPHEASQQGRVETWGGGQVPPDTWFCLA